MSQFFNKPLQIIVIDFKDVGKLFVEKSPHF